MAVTAPFQFARIPRAVWFPEWGDLVSHDVPFADGYSGTIDIEIEAMTPLLIGGERRGATDAKPGEVWPVQLPDGTYAIPGSSLQGMFRNILEIACFGKLGPWVDQRRFGIRDISGTPTGIAAYASRMTGRDVDGVIEPKTRAGWLKRSVDGAIAITPCSYARIDTDNICSLAGQNGAFNLRDQLRLGTNAKERYDAFLNTPHHTVPNKTNLQVQVTVLAPIDDAHSCGPIWYTHCTANGPQSGQLVFTGKPAAGDGPRRKHFEFVFYDDLSAIPVEIGANKFEDFKVIHQPPKGSGGKENPNWGYWRSDFENGGKVPIFYVEEVDMDGSPIAGTVASFGTAFMFKLAHKNDTHDMLANSSDQHRNRKDYDLASLIFGGVGDSGTDAWHNHSLKRRASFENAIADPNAELIDPEYVREVEGERKDGFAPVSAPDATILLSPKPSYFPIYVKQKISGNQLDWDNDTHKATEAFATYTPSDGDSAALRKRPELAGSKIWPAPVDMVSQSAWRLPAPAATWGNAPDGKQDKRTTHVRLHALKQTTKFKTVLHVHNLRVAELGAVLWALTWGGNRELRHHIGMGKPFGMGSIRAHILSYSLTSNNGAQDLTVEKLISAFTEKMQLEYPKLGEMITAHTWKDSVQVAALLKAAQPRQQPDYMQLDEPQEVQQKRQNGAWVDQHDHHGNLKMQPGPDSYIGARRDGFFLPAYVYGTNEFRPTRAAAAPHQIGAGIANDLAAQDTFVVGDAAIVKLGSRECIVRQINPARERSVQVKDKGTGQNNWYKPSELQKIAANLA